MCILLPFKHTENIANVLVSHSVGDGRSEAGWGMEVFCRNIKIRFCRAI